MDEVSMLPTGIQSFSDIIRSRRDLRGQDGISGQND
jgi:hypothetical protein